MGVARTYELQGRHRHDTHLPWQESQTPRPFSEVVLDCRENLRCNPLEHDYSTKQPVKDGSRWNKWTSSTR